eukprot:258322-Amphidinium_carterae.1
MPSLLVGAALKTWVRKRRARHLAVSTCEQERQLLSSPRVLDRATVGVLAAASILPWASSAWTT